MSQIYCVLCSDDEHVLSRFNEFVQSCPRDSDFSLIFFDTVVYENVRIENARPIVNRQHGSANLCECIDKAIELGEKYESTSWADEKTITVLVMADGGEHVSSERVSKKKLAGWNFIFNC
jgi:hypothetical protein